MVYSSYRDRGPTQRSINLENTMKTFYKYFYT